MSDNDRNETETERLDRKWNDLLQELRVMQTGAQLTAGFLLTLPFQQKFADLDTFQRTLYLVAVHRRLSGRHVKERLVRTAHRLVALALTSLALLVTGIVLLIFDVVVDLVLSLVVSGVFGLVLIGLLVLLPHRAVEHDD